MTNIITTIEQDAADVEAWVVGAINQLVTGIAADVNGVLTWLQQNKANIDAVFATLIGTIIPAATAVADIAVPAAAPAITAAAATVTPLLDASQAAIDALSAQVVSGASAGALSQSAYAAYKAAEAAVNQALAATAAATPTASGS